MRHRSNAHVAFNLLGVALVIGLTPQVARVLEYVIPARARREAQAEPQPQ